MLDKDPRLGTLELAFIIAAPICAAGIFAVIGYALWQLRQKHRRYQVDCENSLESCEPMLPPDHSIKDMIDMTTSGSGSGIILKLCYVNCVECYSSNIFFLSLLFHTY